MFDRCGSAGLLNGPGVVPDNWGSLSEGFKEGI